MSHTDKGFPLSSKMAENINDKNCMMSSLTTVLGNNYLLSYYACACIKVLLFFLLSLINECNKEKKTFNGREG